MKISGLVEVAPKPTDRFLKMKRNVCCFALASLGLLGACTLQPPYARPALPIPDQWHNSLPDERSSEQISEKWWTLLGDPAVDALVDAGLRDSPTLAEAAARVERARAALAGQDAAKLPAIGVEGGVSATRESAQSGEQAAASLGLRLSWELDLWGRVRESSMAAAYRLTARNADAQAARLSVISDIADIVLTLRGCNLSLLLRDQDIASRETELTIARARLSFGAIAPVTVAAAESNLASARTDRIAQGETCRYLVNGLVALTGVDAASVASLLLPAPRVALLGSEGSFAGSLAVPPVFVPELPGAVLLHHPGVISAERELAARWSEIAVVRAERLPRIDLAALLTGQWIRVLGSEDSYIGRSAGVSLAGPIFDGGGGAANLRGAKAAYNEAAAVLASTMRQAIREIEDALVARQSAEGRVASSADAVRAARFTIKADEARWRAGAIARYELEESRRQFNRAEDSAILAATDRARAWVALVRRTGAVWDGEMHSGAIVDTPISASISKAEDMDK